MKLKNLFELMGFKGKPKHYGYNVIDYDVGNGKTAHYAQWQHPRESKKDISADLVNRYSAYISEGDFCIDVGAHSGDTTLPMSIAAGTSGCVLALEPNPYIYHVLQKNARANTGIGNINTLMAAATSEECFTEFEYSDSGFCNGGRHENISALQHGHAYTLEVFGVNLENELQKDYAEYLPRLTFIKTDAEGYDLYILKSIQSIISKYSPVIKTEVFKKTSHQYREELLSFFTSLGYTVYKIVGEPMDMGDKLSSENLDAGTHYDILCLPEQKS